MQTEKVALAVEEIAGGLEHPWGMAFLPDGAALVSERPGRMRIVLDGRPGEPLAGVPEVVAKGQGGLLDVALHPGFADNGLVYFTFSEPGEGGAGTGVGRGRLVRDGGTGRLDDVAVIFRINRFTGSSVHFGSRLAFAPDGNLFLTVGERGDAERAQDPGDHAGSVIRITPDGAVPPDNPFVQGGGAPEVWSFGHRNPQGAAIRPADGSLWIHEHGARGGDELNKPQPGRNYGWPETGFGRHYSGGRIGRGAEASGFEPPLYYWDPSIAPSGLAFYDADLIPQWKGNALVGALAFELLARLELDGDRVVHEERLLEGRFGRIRDVAVGPDGAVYLLTDEADGRLLRLAPAD